MKQAFVLAAGLGTRLRPYTDTMPKALVPIGGQPLLRHVIERLKAEGFERIVINIHHFGQQIIDYLAANNNFGLDIRISDERDLLLDTGGGIKHAAPHFDPEYPVFIHNVDILSNLDIKSLYAAYEQAEDIDVALVVSHRQSPRQLQFAPDTRRLVGWQNTQTGDQRGNLGTPLAFAGIHLFSPKLFPLMNDMPDKFSIITFYLNICATQKLVGYEQPDFRFMDAGKAELISEAEAFIASL